MLLGYDKWNYTGNFIRKSSIFIEICKDISLHVIFINKISIGQIFVSFSTNSNKFLIGGVYLPYGSSKLYECI